MTSTRRSEIDPHAERTRMGSRYVTSDPQADAMYVRLARGSVASTREVPVTCLVDMDADGNAIGIELLGVSVDFTLPQYWTPR